MEAKKLLRLLCVLWSVFCLAECVRRNGTRRQRRETCPEGTYTTKNGLNCCLCPEGYHLVQDCTATQTSPRCESCEPGSYLDHANHEPKCELCKECDSNANKVEDHRCTPSSDTVCRCQDDHYCNTADCKVCYACRTCEDSGIKLRCNLTADTQCNEKVADGSQIAPAVIVLIVIVLIVILAVFVLWKLKLLCFKPPETSQNPEQSLKLLKEPDLGQFLPRIAEILGIKVVRRVVRRKSVLSRGTMDNIMDEYPRDAGEQAYQLLNAWYEKHGMGGAYNDLIDDLLATNSRTLAEQVHRLVQEAASHGEAERNGNV